LSTEENQLSIFALGGLNEIGKNMYAIQYRNTIIVIDCGNKFPDESLLGIDLIIPDIAYLQENKAKITIANSAAERREREAEAERRASASEKVQAAKALEESYLAEQEAEIARAKRERATKEADIVVNAEIQKQKAQIDAEAEAERIRRKAKGEADAILFKMEAEANGINEILTKQAEGFKKLVEAAGGDADSAVTLMIADKLPELVRTQVEAIKNIKIDKITVWDNLGNGNGTPSTANFLSGMLKSIPPFEDVFNMAGMELPKYLSGKKEEKIEEKIEDVIEETIQENIEE